MGKGLRIYTFTDPRQRNYLAVLSGNAYDEGTTFGGWEDLANAPLANPDFLLAVILTHSPGGRLLPLSPVPSRQRLDTDTKSELSSHVEQYVRLLHDRKASVSSAKPRLTGRPITLGAAREMALKALEAARRERLAHTEAEAQRESLFEAAE